MLTACLPALIHCSANPTLGVEVLQRLVEPTGEHLERRTTFCTSPASIMSSSGLVVEHAPSSCDQLGPCGRKSRHLDSFQYSALCASSPAPLQASKRKKPRKTPCPKCIIVQSEPSPRLHRLGCCSGWPAAYNNQAITAKPMAINARIDATTRSSRRRAAGRVSSGLGPAPPQ